MYIYIFINISYDGHTHTHIHTLYNIYTYKFLNNNLLKYVTSLESSIIPNTHISPNQCNACPRFV